MSSTFANLLTPEGQTASSSATTITPSFFAPPSTPNDSAEEDNYEPTAQFNPVIPLPDLVQVKTGEEDETVLFEHRAKLLRYVKESKEWKERGIGIMKILMNKNNPNKVRLLMRREQVLKLCCNQMLTKDTKFNKLPKTETALSWFGQDYSENEVQIEMLAIRFKTAEVCERFHDAILKAQENMSDIQVEPEINLKTSEAQGDGDKIPNEQPAPSEGFGEQFKAKPGEWSCKACYTQNTAVNLLCIACEEPKDGSPPTADSENVSTSNAAASTETSSEARLGRFEPTATVNGFGSATFNFSLASREINTSAASASAALDDESVEEEENAANFTPVLLLPEEVEVITGEEDETVLYLHRAKLFRFRDSQWRERGLGDVKILKHNDGGRLRVVMRREEILNICLNHWLNSDIKYTPKDSKSWHFVANDFSENELEIGQFCLRFKTEEIAAEFKEAIDDALRSISIPAAADEESILARLQLPADFFDYKNRQECSGCRGCNAEAFTFPEVTDNGISQTNNGSIPLMMPIIST